MVERIGRGHLLRFWIAFYDRHRPKKSGFRYLTSLYPNKAWFLEFASIVMRKSNVAYLTAISVEYHIPHSVVVVLIPAIIRKEDY